MERGHEELPSGMGEVYRERRVCQRRRVAASDSGAVLHLSDLALVQQRGLPRVTEQSAAQAAEAAD